jgi:hypothetical protein
MKLITPPGELAFYALAKPFVLNSDAPAGFSEFYLAAVRLKEAAPVFDAMLSCADAEWKRPEHLYLSGRLHLPIKAQGFSKSGFETDEFLLRSRSATRPFILNPHGYPMSAEGIEPGQTVRLHLELTATLAPTVGRAVLARLNGVQFTNDFGRNSQ